MNNLAEYLNEKVSEDSSFFTVKPSSLIQSNQNTFSVMTVYLYYKVCRNPNMAFLYRGSGSEMFNFSH